MRAMPAAPTPPALAAAQSLWEAATALLEEAVARATGPSVRKDNGDGRPLWNDLEGRTQDRFSGREVDDFLSTDLQWVERRLLEYERLGADAFLAIAWGIDAAAHHTFCDSWSQSVGGWGTHRLTVGELFPVGRPDPLDLVPGGTRSSQPHSVSGTPNDELRHVRRHRASDFDITVDFTLSVELEDVILNAELVASGHPNWSTSEFEFPYVNSAVMFGVTPKDLDEQERRVFALVRSAIDRGASILVLPELSTTRTIAAGLQPILDDAEEMHVVIAGSFHEGTGPTAKNTAIGLVSGADHQIEHHKFVPLELAGAGSASVVLEGIAVANRHALTVYQAGSYRACVLICKDLLDVSTEQMLVRLGVNLLLVPAMSKKAETFATRANSLATDAQTISVIANGPLAWRAIPPLPEESSTPVNVMAVFGQPFRESTILVNPPDVHDQRDSILAIFKLGAEYADIVSP